MLSLAKYVVQGLLNYLDAIGNNQQHNNVISTVYNLNDNDVPLAYAEAFFMTSV